MALLIKWPAVLTHFECSGYNRYRDSMSYALFESWLLIHRETLKSIRICTASNHSRCTVFNATLFPNLEELEISHWEMRASVNMGAEHSNLLGPKLKTFGWYFDYSGFEEEAICDFQDREALWLRVLVETAIAHKAALRKVKIRYNSYDWECAVYPWDRMDEIRDQVMRPHGLDLVYNEPSMSRHLWLQYHETGKIDWAQANGVHLATINKSPATTKKEEEDSEIDDYLDTIHQQTGYHGQDIRSYMTRDIGV